MMTTHELAMRRELIRSNLAYLPNEMRGIIIKYALHEEAMAFFEHIFRKMGDPRTPINLESMSQMLYGQYVNSKMYFRLNLFLCIDIHNDLVRLYAYTDDQRFPDAILPGPHSKYVMQLAELWNYINGNDSDAINIVLNIFPVDEQNEMADELRKYIRQFVVHGFAAGDCAAIARVRYQV